MRLVAHRLLKRGRRETHASQWLQSGCTMVGQWSPRKNGFYRKHYLSIRAMLLPPVYHHRASFGRPIASIERPLWLHSATKATLGPPRQCLCLHTASLSDLLCLYSSFGGSRKAQGSCCNSCTETGLSVFRRPSGALTFFCSLKGVAKVATLCKRAWRGRCELSWSPVNALHQDTLHVELVMSWWFPRDETKPVNPRLALNSAKPTSCRRYWQLDEIKLVLRSFNF